jgi:malonate-semialdehyde dehydrogenase (acetylating)/methylmalonate-semialdehyde dehydrogenase
MAPFRKRTSFIHCCHCHSLCGDDMQAFNDRADVNHFIDGEVVRAAGARTQPIFNPVTGEKQRKLPLGEVFDFAIAVASAKAALPGWSNTSPIRCARAMQRLLKLMNRHADTFAAITTVEHGKVFSDAKGEVARGIDVMEFACGIPQLLKGDYSEQMSTGMDS